MSEHSHFRRPGRPSLNIASRSDSSHSMVQRTENLPGAATSREIQHRPKDVYSIDHRTDPPHLPATHVGNLHTRQAQDQSMSPPTPDSPQTGAIKHAMLGLTPSDMKESRVFNPVPADTESRESPRKSQSSIIHKTQDVNLTICYQSLARQIDHTQSMCPHPRLTYGLTRRI